MTAIQTTKFEQASQVLSGDWDENGTSSIYLPRDIAAALLRKRGWQTAPHGSWTLAGSRPRSTDEALQLALVAEAV